MKTFLLVLGMILMFASCVEGQTTYKNISKQDLVNVLKGENVQLVDVRTPAEYDQGAIKGAILIDFWNENFLSTIRKKLDKNKPVYLYCKVGGRSSNAAKLLVNNGFKKVYSLDGGYSSWIQK
ncbi:rhodanese-like domain-containing protein [Flavobacteriaceae bacterium S356]|uniref:Rhodanese-like domain-containing protein n=1 Tax=Asprobacillus argus TaxID=3076534 RepID=A0ABU3LBJ9_9FLAO|nr:rhodanese-like domain-containing protein [Flavobacteriaceae bacterium S356]